jgi:hypothetical protein
MALPTYAKMHRTKLIGAAAETTYGTSVLGSVTTALAMHIVDAHMEPVDFLGGGERRPHGNFAGKLGSAVGKRMGRLRFREICRHGAGFTTLLPACWLKNAAGTYSPSTALSDQVCMSIKLWEKSGNAAASPNADYKALVGALGTFTQTFSAGEPLYRDWEFIGVWQTPTAEAMPTPTVAPTPLRYTHFSTLTIGGATVPKVNTVTFSLGNQLEMRSDDTVAPNLLHAYIVDRDPKFTFDFEAHLVADYDPFAKLTAGTLQALNAVLTDGTNTLTMTAPNLQRAELPSGQRSVASTVTETLDCVISSGNDEVTFAEA